MTTEEKYKVIKKRLGLSDEDVARFFGYKSGVSFANSKEGRNRTVAGIVALFEHIGEKQTELFNFDK